MKTNLFSPSKIVLISAVVLLVLAAACKGGGDAPAAPGASGPSALQGQGSGAVQTPGAPAAAGGLTLPDPAGVESFAAFRQRLSVTVQGSAGGKPVDSAQLIEREALGENQSLSVQQNAAGSDPLQFWDARIAGYHYSQERVGGSCRAEPLSPDTPALENLAARLPPLDGLKEAGRETLSGLAAVRYTYSGPGVSGEVWLTANGAAVLKYSLSAQIDAPEFQGKRTWDYTLTPAGAGETVKMPAACQPVPASLPVLPGAESIQLQPGFQRYQARSGRAAAVEFYNRELTALGWEVLPGSTPDKVELSGAVTVLSFSHKEGEGGSILVAQLREQNSSLDVIIQLIPVKQAVQPGGNAPAALATPAGQAEETPTGPAVLPGDLPELPGASVVTQVENAQMLSVSTPPAEVLAFYTAEMEAQGYHLDQKMENAGVIVTTWSKDGRALAITVMENGGATQVMISAIH